MNRTLATILAVLAGLASLAILAYQRPPPVGRVATPDMPVVFAETIVPADEAGNLFDDELVIGIVVKGEAKAYPAGALQATELLHDECGGIPICVTW